MTGFLSSATALWIAAVIGLCVGGAFWVYTAIWAFAMGPIQAHVFRLSSGEARLAKSRLGRRRLRKLQRDLAATASCGPSWSDLRALLGEHYVQLRAANYLVFLPTVVLACVSLGLGLLQLAAAAPIAFQRGDMALIYGSVAVFTGSFVPGVLTFTALRMRWRRRAPFELRWLHEAGLLLRKYGDGDALSRWEQADLGPDLADLHHVLRSRYRGMPSIPNASRREWHLALDEWHSRDAALLQTLGPSTEMARHHARRQVERSARLLLDNRRNAPRAPELVVNVPKLGYSADSATILLLAGLGTMVAVFAAMSFFFSQPSPLAAFSWERVEPVLRFVLVAVPAGGAFAAAVQRWRKGLWPSL